jgi:hypothetical protein
MKVIPVRSDPFKALARLRIKIDAVLVPAPLARTRLREGGTAAPAAFTFLSCGTFSYFAAIG